MKKINDNDILKKFAVLRCPVECWTRVMGYFRPVSSYNEGKKSEFYHRKWFKEEKIASKGGHWKIQSKENPNKN